MIHWQTFIRRILSARSIRNPVPTETFILFSTPLVCTKTTWGTFVPVTNDYFLSWGLLVLVQNGDSDPKGHPPSRRFVTEPRGVSEDRGLYGVDFVFTTLSRVSSRQDPSFLIDIWLQGRPPCSCSSIKNLLYKPSFSRCEVIEFRDFIESSLTIDKEGF